MRVCVSIGGALLTLSPTPPSSFFPPPSLPLPSPFPQLIREAKCLDRMGIEIPESAKIVLLQEGKFKSYFNDLAYALKEYERVSTQIIPVTAALLRPHINDMEYKLRPGMIILTQEREKRRHS